MSRLPRFLLMLIAAGPPALAFGGHAGEMDHPGAPVVVPYELWLGLAGMALLLLLALAGTLVLAWQVRRLDRRLRRLEEPRKR